MLLAHTWDFQWLLPATWSGAMCVAVLNLNNMRDHVSDAKAGKQTLVVRMGFDRSKRYHLSLFLLGWISWWVYALILHAGEWRGMGWIGVLNAVHLMHAFRVFKVQNPAELDPELKRVALSSFPVRCRRSILRWKQHWPIYIRNMISPRFRAALRTVHLASRSTD